jgi:hypothetical protein
MTEIIKNLRASLPRIKHIQDLDSFERKIFLEFRKEKQKRDKRRKKLFQLGTKVRFLDEAGLAQNGIVEKVLIKKIKIKADEDGWIYTIVPSRMGLRKCQ